MKKWSCKEEKLFVKGYDTNKENEKDGNIKPQTSRDLKTFSSAEFFSLQTFN